MGGLQRVGIRELRQNLSRYLRRVEKGEVFRVTDRGRSVAVLAPLREESDALERLISSGRIIPARLDIRQLGAPAPRPAKIPISEALQEIRSEE